jgi:hypothetical protein
VQALEAAEKRGAANFAQAAPVGLDDPNSRTASFACLRKSSSLSADLARDEPMIW